MSRVVRNASSPLWILSGAVLLGSVLLLAAGPRAAPPRPPQPRGPDLASSAWDALRKGDHPLAAERFSASYIERRRESLLCGLGLIAAALKQPTQTADYLRRCGAASEEVPGDFKARVAELATATASGAAELSIGMESPALNVYVGTRFLGTTPLSSPLLLQPGPITLRLETPSQTCSYSLLLRARQLRSLSVTDWATGCIHGEGGPTYLLLLLSPAARAAIPPNGSLWKAIDRNLERHAARLLSPDWEAEVAAQERNLARCITESGCQDRLGESLGTPFVVWLDLAKKDPAKPGTAADIDLTAVVRNVEARDESWRQTVLCEACTDKRLEEASAGLLTRAYQDGTPNPRPVKISATPSGMLFLNGKPQGPTPITKKLLPKQYQVRIERAYFTVHEQPFVVLPQDPASNEELRFNVALQPAPLSGGERFARVGTWIAASLGVAGLVTGAVLYAGPHNRDIAFVGDVPGNWVTTSSGIALMAGGGAGIALSLLLLGVDIHSRRVRRY